jgi:hypothetical protein
MRAMYTIVFSGLQKTAELASDFTSVVGNLVKDVRDCYRPGLHDMRGPGPKMARQVLGQRRMRSGL